MIPESLPPQNSSDHEKSSYVLAIIALCCGSLGAVWSFIGGACCGWAGWGWAFIGLVLSGISLFLKRSAIGWWGLGVSASAFVWVIIQTFLIAGGAASGGSSVIHSLSQPTH